MSELRWLNHLSNFVPLLVMVISIQANALCVSKVKANLRSGPGTKFPVSWVVGRYTPLQKIKRNGAWYQVRDVDGEKHWVHKSVVNHSKKCLTIRVKSANLRTGPGTDFKRAEMRKVDKYTSFRSIGGEDGFLLVEDEFGGRYYVSLSIIWRANTYQRFDL